MSNTQFDEQEVLTQRQQARDKVNIWFDDRSNYYHPIRELLANAVDEISNNFESGTVDVTLADDNKTITVKDSGRGMPILATHKKTGSPMRKIYFETLFAGGKYDNDKDKANTGTNGVGLTAINYTSLLFHVESQHDGVLEEVEYIDGGIFQTSKETPNDSKDSYTAITFKLDPEVYTDTVFDIEKVKYIVKHVAISSNKATFTVAFNGSKTSIHYDSIGEYFKKTLENQTTSKVLKTANLTYHRADEVDKIEVLFTTTPDVLQETFLNGTFLSEGSTIKDGVLNGIRLFGNKYAKKHKLFPKGVTSFTKDDISNSISLVASIWSSKVAFTSQSKFKTKKMLYHQIAKEHITTYLSVAEIEEADAIKKVFAHVIAVQKNNSANDRAKTKLKNKLSGKIEGIGNRVDKFSDSRNHGIDAELFINEGDSAGGSLVQARDPAYQAIYSLKGVILNVVKASWTDTINNDVIMDLIKVIGTGIVSKKKELNTFDIKNARFGKIMIATDADSDGEHIISLIISMIYKLMPELLADGRVYIVKTPLYIISFPDDSKIYYSSEDEKNKKLPKVKGKYTISRLKGLGEVSSEVMEETAMNRDTRNIIQVTMKDAKILSETTELWFGKSVDDRKEFISGALKDYINIE